MEEIFVRGWENFLARADGPMWFRFILQPAVATGLAIRAGVRDAREGRPAFLWSFLTQEKSRRHLVREVITDVGGVFVVAVILDCIYQLYVLRGIYLIELFFTASVLALLPYIFVRGPVNRLIKLVRYSKVPRES